MVSLSLFLTFRLIAIYQRHLFIWAYKRTCKVISSKHPKQYIFYLKILLYVYYLEYLCRKKLLNNEFMTKIIHVHLIFEKKDYYFGSISAIYTVLNDAQIGIKKSSLLHAGLTDGGVKITRRAIIKQSHLIRCVQE